MASAFFRDESPRAGSVGKPGDPHKGLSLGMRHNASGFRASWRHFPACFANPPIQIAERVLASRVTGEQRQRRQQSFCAVAGLWICWRRFFVVPAPRSGTNASIISAPRLDCSGTPAVAVPGIGNQIMINSAVGSSSDNNELSVIPVNLSIYGRETS